MRKPCCLFSCQNSQTTNRQPRRGSRPPSAGPGPALPVPNGRHHPTPAAAASGSRRPRLTAAPPPRPVTRLPAPPAAVVGGSRPLPAARQQQQEGQEAGRAPLRGHTGPARRREAALGRGPGYKGGREGGRRGMPWTGRVPPPPPPPPLHHPGSLSERLQVPQKEVVVMVVGGHTTVPPPLRFFLPLPTSRGPGSPPRPLKRFKRDE